MRFGTLTKKIRKDAIVKAITNQKPFLPFVIKIKQSRFVFKIIMNEQNAIVNLQMRVFVIKNKNHRNKKKQEYISKSAKTLSLYNKTLRNLNSKFYKIFIYVAGTLLNK